MVDVAKESSQLVQDLGREVYYGLNLAIILSEASQEERDVFRKVLDRAKDHRDYLTNKSLAKAASDEPSG